MRIQVLRYINTVRFLKPSQIYYQFLHRLPDKKYVSFQPFPPPVKFDYLIPELDLDKNYLNRFEIAQILKSEIKLLNETYHLNTRNWTLEDKETPSRLWIFNLHYFEYLIPLAADYSKTGNEEIYIYFRKIIKSWIENHKKTAGEAWESYTISLRIPNWLLCFELFGDIFESDDEFKDMVYQSIYSQYCQCRLQNIQKYRLKNDC